MSRRTIVALGDSQTDDQAGWGVDGFLTWPPVLVNLLTLASANVRARSFGVGGDTTTQMLARADDTLFYDTPSVGFIYGGVNDPAASISQATTQANVQALIKVLKHGAKGAGLGGGCTVADQTALPATGELGQRYVVLSDTSTTGGAAKWHSSQATTITGSQAADANGQKQTVWEYRYPLAGEAGWGRVKTNASIGTVVPRIVVVSTNYLNWSAAGDTTGTPYATYTPVRAAQAAAVAAENVNDSGGLPTVVYVDLYNFQRDRIVAGTDTQGDFKWHVADANQHHNPYGHQLVAQAILDPTRGIPAATLTAWLAALA